MGMNSLGDPSSTPTQPGDAPAQSPPAARCPYCGGLLSRPRLENIHDRLKIAPGTWSFWQCGACGAASLNPMPSPEALAGYYPDIYTFAPDLGDQGFLKRLVSRWEYRLLYQPLYRADARRIAKYTGGQCHGKRLLDVGCGRGLRLLGLRQMGYLVEGVDFQRESVRYVEEELGIPARCCDVGGLHDAFPPGTFDLVVAYYLLEHVTDPPAIVRSCFQLLKPGGWFLAAVPLVDSVQAAVFGARWCGATEAPRHVTLPSQQAMLQLGRACGFDRVVVEPDSTRSNAAMIAMTLMPAANTNAVYGKQGIWSLGTRLLGTFIAAASAPCSWLESYLLRRPACGVVCMHKPEESR